MKKRRITVMIVVVILLAAATSFAAEPQIDGDIRVRIQTRTGDTSNIAQGTETITRVRLNAEIPVEDNLSVYGRLAMDQAGGMNHNNGLYDTSGMFDRYGLTWKYAKGSLKLGKQDVVLGQPGLVLTTLIDAVGADNQLFGITATGRFDGTAVKLVGGRLGEGLFPVANVAANLYGLQIDHAIDKRLSVGATYRRIAAIDGYSSYIAQVAPPHKAVLDTYSALSSYQLDAKTQLYAEVGRSNATLHNFGLGLGAAHQMNAKNSYSINYFRQGINSGLFRNWGAPDFAASSADNTYWNGYAVYYRHQMDRRTGLEISNYFEQGNHISANQFRVTLMASF